MAQSNNFFTVIGRVENTVTAPQGHLFFRIVEPNGSKWHCRAPARLADLITDLNDTAIFRGRMEQKHSDNENGSTRVQIYTVVDDVLVNAGANAPA